MSKGTVSKKISLYFGAWKNLTFDDLSVNLFNDIKRFDKAISKGMIRGEKGK
jgi:hypothetical protein